MAPHGIYPAQGEDEWIAISVRDDADWQRFGRVVEREWATDPRFAARAARLAAQDELDALVSGWTQEREKFELERALQLAGVPAAAVQRPAERIDHDPETERLGLWPQVEHTKMGKVRVDGLPVRFSKTPWKIEAGGPCLGEHTDEVLARLIGLSQTELDALRAEGVI